MELQEQKAMKRIAKIIRIITIPTTLFFVVLLLTYFLDKDAFNVPLSFITPFIFIGCFVLLSYVVSFIIYKIKRKNNIEVDLRATQRTLAFIFSFIGYLVAFTLNLALNFNEKPKILISTYFFSVCFLSLLNIFKIKASGHAAGITGPLIFGCTLINIHYIIPCMIIYGLSLFASLYLKRHTIIQFILGSLCSILGFLVSIIIF